VEQGVLLALLPSHPANGKIAVDIIAPYSTLHHRLIVVCEALGRVLCSQVDNEAVVVPLVVAVKKATRNKFERTRDPILINQVGPSKHRGLQL
jgi:hypothetical protein